jgi:hypothetical protein
VSLLPVGECLGRKGIIGIRIDLIEIGSGRVDRFRLDGFRLEVVRTILRREAQRGPDGIGITRGRHCRFRRFRPYVRINHDRLFWHVGLGSRACRGHAGLDRIEELAVLSSSRRFHCLGLVEIDLDRHAIQVVQVTEAIHGIAQVDGLKPVLVKGKRLDGL